MEVSSLSGALKALARIIWPEMRKLRAERHAAQASIPVRPENDSLDKQLEDALARLGSIDDNQGFWRRLLTEIGAAYTRPTYFEFSQIRNWLSDDQVRHDLKSLARERFIGKNAHDDTLNRIREKYTEMTGVGVYGATYAIPIVLAVLHASVRATLSSSGNIIADLVKDAHADTAERIGKQSQAIEDVERQLHRLSPQEDPLHGEVLREELDRIIKLRAIPGINSADEIEALIAKIQNEGSLSRAPVSDKAEVYYWAARILALDEKKASQAKSYLYSYKNALPHYDTHKVTYIEAWLHEAEGHTQDAIAILSDLNTPDARTSLLSLLANRDGNAAALAWLAENKPYAETLLSPAGWRNAAGMMAEEGRWQEGIDLLKNLSEEVFVSFPDLFFVKGLLHASFLLPKPTRPKLLQLFSVNFEAEAQEGEDATNHRRQSIKAFRRAHELLLTLEAEERARGCEYHLMWIRLTDPQERDAARLELTENMKDGEYASFMLNIALNFNATFDPEPLKRYLRRRKREGRQEPQEHIAQFLLTRHFGTPNDVLEYLEKEETTLKEIILPEPLAATKIDALVKSERIADAEKELERCVDIFSPDDFERQRLMIADRKGEELKQLEALYKRTSEYQDLANLVRYLEHTQQWTSLLPYARKRLETHKAMVCLRTLIQAMQQTGAPDEDIVACLDEHQDLVIPHTPEGDELLFYRGLALFGLGRFSEAGEIAEDIAENSHNPNALSLEINIALRTGQWEHFTAIIDREFPRLEEFSPQLLLQMASVVADWDQGRAMEIINIATEKEPGNGEVQANAYWLATQIGRDIDATTWLQRTMNLAQEGKGPVQRVTLRELVEKMPSYAEQRREWEQQYLTGEIGLHQAAIFLNVPLTHILVGGLLGNEKETDPRRRTVIPIRYGGRSLVQLSKIRSIALDLSSLLLLESLEVLSETFTTLERVYLSPRLMDVLFIEHRQVRFHQPSRVEKARRILKLIDDEVIKLLPEVRPPEALVTEVGEEMACLLHMAQTNSGRVLSTLPMHKAESLGEEDADLREFGPLVLKATQFLPYMERYISLEVYARARSYLTLVDHGEPLGGNDWEQGPLYVSNLALTYLDTAEILQHLHRLDREIFVANSVKAEAKGLIDATDYGDEIAGILDRLRRRIRDGVQSGKIIFLPESGDRENREVFLPLNALQDLIGTTGYVEAVCLDDRVFGKHAHVTDQHNRNVPIVGSVDVLEYLSERGAITEEKKRTCEFRLRKGGFTFLPLDIDGILAALRASVDGAQTQFAENGELAAIRENLQRIRSMKLLRVPEEMEWLSQVYNVARQMLDKIWGDSTIEIRMAEKMSDWIFDVFAPLPTAWVESVVLAEKENITELTKSTLLVFIDGSIILADTERRQAFATWVDQRLIGPLLLANTSLVGEISQSIPAVVSKWAKELADRAETDVDVSVYLRVLLSRLSPLIQERILKSPKFQKDAGINGLMAPFDVAGNIWLGDLLDTVRKAYTTHEEQIVRNLDGDEVRLSLNKGHAAITHVGDREHDKPAARFEFALLSPDAQTRLEAFRAIPEQFGVTGPVRSYWLPILEQRPLSNSEISQIHDAIIRSVPNCMATIKDKISNFTQTQADLVPPLANYFTTLCGPLPNNSSVDNYIRGPLTNHRQALIAEDMLEGLSLVLPGCLRAGASVAPLLSGFNDDEVWRAVERLQDESDPFSLLGLLEIALIRRPTKQEFEVLANDLIGKLCGEALTRRDGLDVYEFFPALVKVSLYHLRRIDSMMTQPPYWHWLCAFTHAGLLTRLLDGLQIKPGEMTRWLESATRIGDVTADILALRSEPTWNFHHLTRYHIQAEILGRLKELEISEEAHGRQLPNRELLNRRIEEFIARGVYPFRPGPLEGNSRPMNRKTERTLPDRDVTALISKLNERPDELSWVGVAEISAIFFLPEELRNSLTESLKTIKLPGGTFVDRTNTLAIAGSAASIHKDRDMAEVIVERLFQECEGEFKGEHEIRSAFWTLLVASATIDDNEWIEWLKDKLYRLALTIPQKHLKYLSALIDELKTLLPISQWRFGQVEALCRIR